MIMIVSHFHDLLHFLGRYSGVDILTLLNRVCSWNTPSRMQSLLFTTNISFRVRHISSYHKLTSELTFVPAISVRSIKAPSSILAPPRVTSILLTITIIISIMSKHRYRDLHIGAAWVGMIEPSTGSEASFNRCYSDDHFYAGGMCLPGTFAGRRRVATKAPRELRHTSNDDMKDNGCYLHLDLFAAHLLDEINVALSTTLQDLGAKGRMYGDDIPRRHLYTAITPYRGAVYKHGDAGEGPADIHALDYPFKGVVLEIVDAKTAGTRPLLLQWLKEDFVPMKIGKTPDAAMCLIFIHANLPAIIKSPRLPG